MVRRLATSLCLTNLIFVVGMLMVLGHVHQLLYGVPPVVKGVLLLPSLSAVLTVAVTALLLPLWRHGHQTLPVRLHYSLLVIAAIAFLWSLHYWRLW